MTFAVFFALLLLIGLLTLVSYVDRVYQEAGRFLSREFQDNIDAFEQKIEPALKVSRSRASLSMAVLKQLTVAAIALLIGYAIFHDPDWNIYDIAQAAISLLLIVIVCNRFLPFLFFSRTKGEWLRQWVLLLKGLIYLVMPVTVVVGFLQSVVTLTRENTTEQPETNAEAVDALIEAGQEEGIIQEGDRDLIQSVVEFSGKTVREAMKPRPVMFAVPTSTTVEQFIEMLRAKHYSRVPVMRTASTTSRESSTPQMCCRCPIRKRTCATSIPSCGAMFTLSPKASLAATCSARCRSRTSAWPSWSTSTAGWRD